MSAQSVPTDPDRIKDCIIRAIKERSRTLNELRGDAELLPIGKHILMACVSELINQEGLLEMDREGVLHYVAPKK